MKRTGLILLALLLLAACGGESAPAGDGAPGSDASPLADVDGPAFVYFFTDN